MRKTLIQVFTVNIISKVFVGLAVVLAIRFMSEPEYARYTLALAIATVATQTFSAVYNLIYVVGFEALGLEHEPEPFVGLQLLTLALGVLVAMFVFPPWSPLFVACTGFVLFGILSEYSKTCFQQRLEFRTYSSIEVLRSSVFLICGAAFALYFRNELRSWQMLWAQAAGMLVVFLIAGRPRLRMARVADRGAMMRIVRIIWSGPYRYAFAYFVLLAVFSQTDIWALKYLRAQSELATYGAAFRYYMLLQMALGTLSVVLLPSLQKVKSLSEFRAILAEHRRLLWIFGMTAVVGAAVSGWLIPVLDGGKYPGSILVFRILVVSAVVSFALSPYASLLARFCDFRFQAGAVACVLAGNVALLALTVPAYGAPGAAVSMAVSYAALNGTVFIRARWRLRTGSAEVLVLSPENEIA